MKKDIQIIVKFTKLIKESHPVVRERVHFLSLAKVLLPFSIFYFLIVLLVAFLMCFSFVVDSTTTSSLFNVLVL